MSSLPVRCASYVITSEHSAFPHSRPCTASIQIGPILKLILLSASRKPLQLSFPSIDQSPRNAKVRALDLTTQVLSVTCSLLLKKLVQGVQLAGEPPRHGHQISCIQSSLSSGSYKQTLAAQMTGDLIG